MQDTGLRVAGRGDGTRDVPASAGPPGRAAGASRWSALLSGRRGTALTPWLFLAPALIIFAAFKFVPMVRAVQMRSIVCHW